MPNPNEDAAGSILSFMDAIRGDVQARLQDSCSFMHIKAMDFVVRQNEPTMSEIAGFLKITSPGATMIVDKLVENKELDRHSDTGDRRIVRLRITSKGRATLDAGMKIIREKIAERLACLNKAEQKQLTIILDKLHKTNDKNE